MRPGLRYQAAISLCLLSMASVLLAVDLPTTVQFDLVFPKNNTAYKPTNAFPLVFALHNGSAALPYSFYWYWSVDTGEKVDPFDTDPSGGYNPGVPGQTVPPPPEDKQLIVDAVFWLKNATTKQFRLRYGFGLLDVCNETIREVPFGKPLDVFFYDFIDFSFDSENGISPNVTATGSCAVPIGTIGIEKEVITHRGKACPIVKPGLQPTQACALTLDEAVNDQIAEAVLHPAGSCVNQTWPNVTAKFRPCPLKKSMGRKQTMDQALWGTLLVLTGASIALLY